jgi:hypothetical protein
VHGPRQQDEFVLVPARVAQLFAHILNQFAQGKAVTIVPNEAMLTTQDAADFLNGDIVKSRVRGAGASSSYYRSGSLLG